MGEIVKKSCLMLSVSKYLALVISAILLTTSDQVKANAIAQGQVQVTITAYAYVPITSATCEVDISTYDSTALAEFTTSESVNAVVQAGTITCTVMAPYYWNVTSLGGVIFIGYSISAQSNASVTKYTSGGLGPIPLSTTGTTTRNVITVF
jgi:hypothetical protein